MPKKGQILILLLLAIVWGSRYGAYAQSTAAVQGGAAAQSTAAVQSGGYAAVQGTATVQGGGYALTQVSGYVTDADTGEPIGFAQVYFVGSSIGTTTDLDGYFSLKNSQGLTKVEVSMIGYKTYSIELRRGKSLTNQRIKLEAETYALDDVVIKPEKKKRDKYTRKGNPAVELVGKVIANKDKNYMHGSESYSDDMYEKLVVALDPFDYDLDKNKFWQKFKCVEKYVDTSMLDTTAFLPFTMRENMYKEYRKKQRVPKQIVLATNQKGLGFLLDQGGLQANLETIFRPVDITDNDIDILTNKFVSPLSTPLANATYHYYIMDTIMVEGEKCVDLAFVPVNSESYSFLGHLYIALDSTYALKKYQMNVSEKINLNWVKQLRLSGDYRKTADGQWVANSTMTEVSFTITRKQKHSLFARQTRIFTDYEQGATAPDSIFGTMQGNKYVMDNASKYPNSAWDTLRPVSLQGSEVLFDSLTTDLLRVPTFRGLVNAYTMLSGDYIPTSRYIEQSKWDFCPITSTATYNGIEGWRVRIGGMTTSNVNPHFFFHTYIAYGFKDKRPKGMVRLIYSFNEKKYHPMESLRHAIYLEGVYDLEVPGNVYGVVKRDHIFMAIDPQHWVDGKWNRKMQYVARASLKYEKEWENRMSVLTWAEYEHNTATGDLQYMRLNGDGTTTDAKKFQDVMWTVQVRYSPGAPIYNNRYGSESVFNLSHNAPVFRIQNTLGYMIEDKIWFNKTEISAEYRWWISMFGHIDLSANGGMIWASKGIPYPKLYIPPTNSAIFLNPKSFNLMQPLEFYMDKYVMWNMDYHMKGLIFNRIPVVNKLKLREVVSFKGIWGTLSAKNDPASGAEGLYVLPTGSSALDWHLPYMEMTAGIENIFKFVRIDYIRRLTYTKGLGPWQRNGIKFTFSATF